MGMGMGGIAINHGEEEEDRKEKQSEEEAEFKERIKFESFWLKLKLFSSNLFSIWLNIGLRKLMTSFLMLTVKHVEQRS